jgi:hypothetical protein
MEFHLAAPVPPLRHPPSREQERREEARARWIIFAIIAGAACLLGLVAWLATEVMASRREEQRALQERQDGLGAFSDILKREEERRREEARQREEQQAAMRESAGK